MAIVTHCPKCNEMVKTKDEFAGKKGRCPTCGEIFTLPAPTTDIQPAATAPEAPPAPEPDDVYQVQNGSSAAQPTELPVEMRANQVIAGRTCTICRVPIALGDEVRNCEHCKISYHKRCWDQNNGCATSNCVLSPTFTVVPPEPTPQAAGVNTKQCPFCGEMIKLYARKCRYCGEFLDSTIAPGQRADSHRADESMTGGDWLVAILCSGIGCIVGIVWMIQGKPKGLKMTCVSIGFAILWTIVRLAIEAA